MPGPLLFLLAVAAWRETQFCIVSPVCRARPGSSSTNGRLGMSCRPGCEIVPVRDYGGARLEIFVGSLLVVEVGT